MKIVVFKRASFWGGGESYTKTICEGLEEKDHQIYLISDFRELLRRTKTSEKRGADFLPRADQRGRILLFLIFWPIDFLRYFFILAEAKFRGYTAVIFQDLNEKMLATFAAKILGFKIFWVEHTTWEPYLISHKLFFALKTAGRLTAKIIVPSKFLAAQVKKIPALSKKIEIVPHGVEPVRLGGKKQKGGLVCISRFTPDKNVGGLIEAMPYLELKAKLKIIGEGPEKDELLLMARNLGLEGRVEFTGEKTEPFQEISPRDILVVPSREENFSLVVIEAMSAGLPIVATNAGGILEQIKEGEGGYISAPNEPKKMAQMIEKLLADKSLRERFSKANKKRFKAEFTREKMIAKTIKLLNG